MIYLKRPVGYHDLDNEKRFPIEMPHQEVWRNGKRIAFLHDNGNLFFHQHHDSLTFERLVSEVKLVANVNKAVQLPPPPTRVRAEIGDL